MDNGVIYGQKLPLKELGDEQWQKKYAEISLLGLMLREQGISFVEFPINEDTEAEIVYETAKTFSNEGVSVSLHPYLHKELAPEIFDQNRYDDLERLLTIVHQTGEITGAPVPCVFHGGLANMKPHMVPEQKALLCAKTFFAAIDSLTALKYSNVIPFCETQTPWSASSKGALRLGDTYKGCLELIEGTSIGICWDFGHTFRASYLKKHDLYPDEHFLARVKHVHAHDTILLGDQHEDHFPLGSGIVPWKEYCAELARHEYNDTVLLEVPVDRFSNLEDFLHSVCRSVEMLNNLF
ncbi:MAG TPA: TIM barrel protein [Chitinispirillaceae bacterium]|nr:TIM barrel protein [Chitinispirillaceae bacterium]